MWYYIFNGKQIGPISLQELKEMAQKGVLNAQTFFWKSGMPNWIPGGQIAELAKVFPPVAHTQMPPTPTYNQPTNNYQPGPAPYQQGPNNYQAGPAPYQQGPNNYQPGPAPYQQGPNNYQPGPAPYQQGPNNYQNTYVDPEDEKKVKMANTALVFSVISIILFIVSLFSGEVPKDDIAFLWFIVVPILGLIGGARSLKSSAHNRALTALIISSVCLALEFLVFLLAIAMTA